MSKYYDELLGLAEKDEAKVKKTLINNYVQSIAEMKKKIKDYTQTNEELSFAKQMELKRYDSLIEQMNVSLKKLYDNNHDTIVDYDKTTFDREYFGIFYEVENVANVNLQFSTLNESYITQAIEAPIEGLKLSERLYDKNLNDMKLRVKGAVTQGLINSSGYAAIAEAISSIGWTDFNHAMTIAITEAGRIKSLARQKGQQEAVDKGVKLEKKWLSTLDKKTRHSHQKLDGQTVGIDEEFEINGHKAPQPRLFGVASEDIRCRCDTVTVVEGISPKLRRDNETGKIIEYKNYEEWVNAKDLKKEKKVTKTIEAASKYAEKFAEEVDYSKFKIETANAINKKFDELFKIYNVPKFTKLSNKTSQGAAGTFKGTMDTSLNVKRGSMAVSAMHNNIDTLNDMLQDFKTGKNALKLGKYEPLDALNQTITHEFGHVLYDSKLSSKGLLKEIRSIKTRYSKEINTLRKKYRLENLIGADDIESEDLEKFKNIFISTYADTDTDEWVAEAFADATLSERPSPYSLEVLEAIKKYVPLK